LGIVRGQFGHVLATVFDGLRITLEEAGEVLHAAVAKLFRFHGCVATSVFFRERFIKRFHVAFNGRWIMIHELAAY
jgi:hypothetical protein